MIDDDYMLEEPEVSGDAAPDESLDPEPEEPVETVETVEASPRLFLTTDFEEYTVTEGLLLSLLLFAFVAALARIIRRGFRWLL